MRPKPPRAKGPTVTWSASRRTLRLKELEEIVAAMRERPEARDDSPIAIEANLGANRIRKIWLAD